MCNPTFYVFRVFRGQRRSYYGTEAVNLLTSSVRNLFRRLNPEFIEFDLAPDTIELASLEELNAAVAHYETTLQESTRELIISAHTHGSEKD